MLAPRISPVGTGRPMNRNHPQRAYLLRCWQEGGDVPGGATRWRFSAEEVLSKRPRRGFDDLEALFHFLRAEMARGGDEAAI
jgi:hypothetical protein